MPDPFGPSPSHSGPSPRPAGPARVTPALEPVQPTRPASPPPITPVRLRPEPARGETPPGDEASRRGRPAIAAVAAVAAIAAVFAIRGPQPAWDGPQAGPNWKQVAELTAKHRAGEVDRTAVMKIRAGADPTIVSSITLSDTDVDTKTTAAVRDALQRNDVAAAEAALQAAQHTPSGSVPEAIHKAMSLGDPDAITKMHEVPAGEEPQPVQPKISAGMADTIRAGDTKFFHIFLYDNCVEDGDIVRVVINGEPFAVAPLTRQGMTLSIPVNSGQTFEVRLAGIRDGGGGITVACQTSDGAYFSRAMEPGEEAPLTFVPASGGS